MRSIANSILFVFFLNLCIISSKDTTIGSKVFRHIGNSRPESLSLVMANMNANNNELQHSVRIDGRFKNPWPTWKLPSFYNLIKFLFETNHSNVPSKEEELNKTLPILNPKFDCEPDRICMTWIGHSTVLIQFDGITILTDPIFSLRASVTQLIGPARYRRAAININELPPIDAVVISHNHYDHLDQNSVVALNARFGDGLHWFVPLNLSDWMHDVGCKNVTELDWWQQHSLPDKPDVKFVLTPAQHWTKRGLNDDCKVLWGSWTVIGPKHRFFFAGDTGYCSVFKQIGETYGPFDASAIPIGAYEPRWFMAPQHVDPEEAVLIHKDIKSKLSVAIHWGTFALAHEHYLEPPKKLKNALKDQKLRDDEFITLSHGETKVI